MVNLSTISKLEPIHDDSQIIVDKNVIDLNHLRVTEVRCRSGEDYMDYQVGYCMLDGTDQYYQIECNKLKTSESIEQWCRSIEIVNGNQDLFVTIHLAWKVTIDGTVYGLCVTDRFDRSLFSIFESNIDLDKKVVLMKKAMDLLDVLRERQISTFAKTSCLVVVSLGDIHDYSDVDIKCNSVDSCKDTICQKQTEKHLEHMLDGIVLRCLNAIVRMMHQQPLEEKYMNSLSVLKRLLCHPFYCQTSAVVISPLITECNCCDGSEE